MSVIPVNVGVTQSNLQSVQRNEEDLPAVFDDMQMLPQQERNEIIYNNIQAMMNIESVRRNAHTNQTQHNHHGQSDSNTNTNNEYELIDVSENGVQRVTGDGVRPIVDILHSMEQQGMESQQNAIGSNGPSSFHLRNSPFVDVINPLFQTGERIQNMSNEMQGAQQFQGDTRAVSKDFIENLPEIECADEDCSICLEDLKSSDVPPQKYMIQQKTIAKLKESLNERNIEYREIDTKRDLIEKLWNDRENKNKNQAIKELHCKHMFHLRCLREWLQKRDTCPVCRSKVQQDQQGNESSQNSGQTNTNNDTNNNINTNNLN